MAAVCDNAFKVKSEKDKRFGGCVVKVAHRSQHVRVHFKGCAHSWKLCTGVAFKHVGLCLQLASACVISFIAHLCVYSLCVQDDAFK